MELTKNGTQPNSPLLNKNLRKTKTFRPQNKKNEKKNIESMDFKEINALIESTREIKHNYSRSTTIAYVPLTKLQKITMIEEMNTASNNKMMKYSGIFNEIKNQITDLSISLKSSFNEKKPHLKAKGSTRVAFYCNSNQIKEEQDEEMISPSIQKTIHFPEDNSVIDETNLGEVDELKNNFVVNNTLKYNIDNTKLFEKVKEKRIVNSPKIVVHQRKKNTNQRRQNLILNDNERHREELMTNTNSNHPLHVKEDSVNLLTKSIQLQSNDTSIIVESCQCITF